MMDEKEMIEQEGDTVSEFCPHHGDKCEDIAEARASARSAHHRLDGVDHTLEGHGAAIGRLEATTTKTATTVDHLDRRISSLVTAVWGLVLTLFGAILAFVFGMIQGGFGK